LCSRTVCALAHVFESAGLATVALASVRSVAERMHPPRALYCEFPLGRPLGVPGDPAFQHEVLSRAFALLDRSEGPVLEDHPTVIEADETPLACPMPPRYDPDALPAVDEARGLRNAYDRARAARGHSLVGRVLGPDQVPAALEEFDRIAEGLDWLEADLPGSDTISSVHDIRTYYEEAALELVDAPAGGRAAEAWFYETTEAGKVVMAARRSMKAADAPQPFWYYMAPGHRR
jgi:hypothetical protein